MKALQLLGGRSYQIVDLDLAEPGPEEVRVRIEAVTICTQWDLHLRSGEPMIPGHPFQFPYAPGQPGHEASGTIEAVGPEVRELVVGDRVSLWRDPGHHIQGAYATHVVRPEHEVIRVPAHLAPSATAPVELAMCLACSIQLMAGSGLIRGKRLAVMGLGPAGLIAVQMFRAEGAAEVIGIDPVCKRREIALRLGACAAYSPEEFRSSELAIDSALDCVGAKATVELLLDRVRDSVAIFGVLREDVKYKSSHFFRGVKLLGYPSHNREAAEYAVGLIEAGKLDLAPIISHHLPMDQYAEAIDLLETQEATKVCLYPNGLIV
ncbi:MAG: zinc-dependent alcohol dehydrogenase [Fimbriimonas sp.]